MFLSIWNLAVLVRFGKVFLIYKIQVVISLTYNLTSARMDYKLKDYTFKDYNLTSNILFGFGQRNVPLGYNPRVDVML